MRTLDLPILLVATTVAALVLSQQIPRLDIGLPGLLPTTSQSENNAGGSAAAANLGSAVTAMQAHYNEFSTYAGATMPGGTTIVRADGGSYCLQYGTADGVMHLAGPNGHALPGAC